MAPEKAINFINSSDNVYYKFKTKIFFLVGTIFLCVIQNLINVFSFNNNLNLIDLYVSICFSSCAFIAFIGSFITKNTTIMYLTYGTGLLIISSYLSYFSLRVTIFPSEALCGLMGLTVWIVASIICIISIISNINKDYYNKTNSDTQLYLSGNDGKRYGIIITWKTIAVFVVYIFASIFVTIIFFLYPDSVSATKNIVSKIFQLGLFYCSFTLSCCLLFSWKLIIKFVIKLKYKI